MGIDLKPGEHEIYNGHPSWRATLGFYVLGLLIAVMGGAIALLLSGGGAAAAVGGGIFVIVLIVGWLRRITTRYTITNQRIYVRHGILARHVDQTRLERLQDISTDQTFFERMLGIGRVHFDTAGGDLKEGLFRFHGVANPDQVVRAVDDAQHAAQQAPAAGHLGEAASPPAPRPSDGL